MQLQALEVAIALAAVFFGMSVVASVVVEIVARAFKKRSKDLVVVLDEMLSTGSTNAVDIKDTSIYKAMQVASRRKRGRKVDDRTPSYMSARSFADGVLEGIVKLKAAHGTIDGVITNLPAGPLKDRIGTLQAEANDDLLAIKAGLEGWFDDTMDRLEGAYKRWSQWFLLFIGLALAVGLNISAVRIADTLWNDSTLRTAVADTATNITDRPCPDPNVTDCAPEDRIEKAISDIEGLQLPIGWSEGWADESGVLMTVIGMLWTGSAVMLGAPFWFDLLTRLGGARGSGGVPPKASNDRGSATFGMVELGVTRGGRTLSQL